MKKCLFALAALSLLFACTGKEEEAPVVKVQSIAIEQSDMTLTEGESVNLSAKVLPENAADKTVNWSSSNESVLMVSSNGKAMALSLGNAIITAKSGDKSDFITITVEAKVIPVTGVSLDKTQITIKVGESETLTPTITPEDATNKKVSWTSSNDNVATVEDGKVVGVQPGSVTITVTTEDGAKTAECPVTVKSNLAPSVTVGADHLSAVSVVLSGKANLESTSASDLKVGFQYSKSAGILPSNSTTIEASDADADYNYTTPITGLDPDTKYYFRSFVRQNGQDTYGETKEFTTKALSSMLHAMEASSVSAVSACLNATLDLTNVRYESKSLGFYWGSSAESVNTKLTSREGSNSISADLLSLTPSKEYYFRAYIVLDGKEYKEEVVSFTTKDIESILGTLDATGIEATKASLNAKLDLSDVKYSSISYGFYWGASESSQNNGLSGGEIKDNAYSAPLTGLSHKTQYWYKAYIKLDSQTFYGVVKTFTTDVVPVESVSVDKTEYTFHTIGNTLTLKATVLPADATDKSVEWSSDKEDVAAVDANGRVTAKGNGKATITVTTKDQGKSATCVITVAQWVTSITLDKSSVPLIVGETGFLDATVNPSHATDPSLVWSSSNQSVASVNPSTGVVLAAKRGTAVITATANDGSEVNASYKVIVRNSVPEGAVDLGLSVHWATCNVSIYSDKFGQNLCWFQWGSHNSGLKLWYSGCPWMTWSPSKFYFYKYVTRSGNLPPNTTYEVDNKTVLELEDDAAYYYLGDSWRMPTEAECKELLDNCLCVWTTYDGKAGVQLRSKIEGFENHWIFLPAMGYRPGVNSAYADYFIGDDILGFYWSSSLYLNNSKDDSAWCISFDSDGVKMSQSLRLNGLTIRPVSE